MPCDKHQVSDEKIKQWSPFIAQVQRRYPDVVTEHFLRTPWSASELQRTLQTLLAECPDGSHLKQILRQVRNQQLAKLAYQEFQGEVRERGLLEALSSLAEQLIQVALDTLMTQFCQRYGTPMGEHSGKPQSLIVLGMGKLGGRELNFSSDIDLVFVYPEAGHTQGAEGAGVSLSNEQFFTRLGQALNQTLNERTADGFVYRVDMRLRPFGQTGPLVSTFSALETYYQLHGRAWERYAAVKARALTGEADDIEYLNRNILTPFIYRRYTDFSAIESLRALKHKIAIEIAKKRNEDNIKLGAGGIREAEFVVQAFQLIYGGRQKRLQTQSWFLALQGIVDLGYLEETQAQVLREAYLYLRRVENRLQAHQDEQTQQLPTQPQMQQLLAESFGFETYAAFLIELNIHRQVVMQAFSEVFDASGDLDEGLEKQSEIPSSSTSALCELCDLLLDPADAFERCPPDEQRALLKPFGFSESQSEAIFDTLRQFRRALAFKYASQEALSRLAQLLPSLLQAVAQTAHPVQTLQRVLKIIESILRRSIYLVLLNENPHVLESIVHLCAASPWLTEQLAQHPMLFDQLISIETIEQLADAHVLKQEALDIVAQAQKEADSDEAVMHQLRLWRHAQVFKVAVADIQGALPLMQVSDHLTWIAEAVLAACVTHAIDWCQQRFGKPAEIPAQEAFMVIGYGKLGGQELGYGSDLDIVMLYQGASPHALSTGDRPLENALYYLRLGQKVISLLTTPMPSGKLYEVDTRLRPNGGSGLMVTDFDSYTQYLTHKAWVWEHQAFVRARPVVAAPAAHQAFQHFRQRFLSQPRTPQPLKQAVKEMLEKMRRALDKSDDQWMDLKYGVGGIVEIEFLVQYGVLLKASQAPELSQWTDNIRLLKGLQTTDLLPKASVADLIDIYQAYRACYHQKALQNEKTLVPKAHFQSQAQRVHEIWLQIMGE